MPQNSTFQRWYEHRLWLLIGAATEAPALGSAPSALAGPRTFDDKISTYADDTALHTATTGVLVQFDKIRSLNLNSDATRETLQTRDEARTGIETQVDISSTLTKDFQVRYQRANIDTTTTAPGNRILTDDQAIIRALMLAQSTGSGIGAIDMDSGLTDGVQLLAWGDTITSMNGGAFGVAANWSVTFNITKEAGSVVYADLSLTASEFPEYVEWDNTGVFIPFVE